MIVVMENPAPLPLVPTVLPINSPKGADTPPLAAGLATVMLDVPTPAISAAFTDACRLVLEMKVVVRGLPFHCTVEEATKFVPVTVSVNAVPPAMAEPGFNNVIVGAFAAGVAGGAGVGGGVSAERGAGLTKLPPTRNTWPLAPPVMKASPFCPQRIKRVGVPATPGIVMDVTGVKCV